MLMREREITEQDLIAAANLRRIWNDRKRFLGLTLEKAGERLGLSHSALSQYMNGKLPIGDTFLLKVSELLGVEPKQIRPEFPYKLYLSDDGFSSEARELARYYEILPTDTRRFLFSLIRTAADSVLNDHQDVVIN